MQEQNINILNEQEEQNVNIESEAIQVIQNHDYENLLNKPKINNVELIGNLSSEDLGINIPTNTSDLTNDSGFLTSHQSIKTINNTSMVGTGNVEVQPTLVSGTNIKTINNTSLLGSGNISISGGQATDVQVNGTSIVSNNVANLVTESAYNSSTNKLATMSDLDTKEDKITYTTIPYQQTTINLWDLADGGFIFGDGQELKLFETNIPGDTHENTIYMSAFITTDKLIKTTSTESGYTTINFKIDRGGGKNIVGGTFIGDGQNMGYYSVGAIDTDIPSVPSAGTSASAVSTTASGGSATTYSKSDHVHNITSSTITSALGYTPYNSTNPSGYITSSALSPYALSSSLATVATSGSYNDLTNKPTIPVKMSILSYGNSTWNDFINAYRENAIVYCRASSNSNPASGSQTRLAFMAYVNNADNPTEVEFQYYRSVSSHSASQQGDQVFVYKVTSSGTWTVTTREASSKVVAGTGLSSSYSSGTITLSQNITTSITSSSTDSQVPSAKAVYDLFTSITDADGVSY